MAGQEGLSNIENNIDGLLSRQQEVIDKFVESSLSFKKNFIEIDEFDKGERIKLNFAHTFGHVIEVVSHYEIPHGTAVAIGMIMADKAKEVIGVELNKDAVKDARINAKRNDAKNITFYEKDAGEFLVQMAEQDAKVDVVVMDPPRAGSD